jgi:hypothetical protein
MTNHQVAHLSPGAGGPVSPRADTVADRILIEKRERRASCMSPLRASSLRVVRKPRPGRRRLVEQFGSDRLIAQLLNQDAIAAADVLERDLRASPIPGVDVDDRLHALFAVERSPATVGLTSSVDAAIAFALAVGLAPSIYVKLDGLGWAELGGIEQGTFWRWQTDRADLHPATAVICEMLRLFTGSSGLDGALLR